MSELQHPQAQGRDRTSTRQYQRAYKACIRCRQTKAKCAPLPNSQSCVKCSRESRVCEFPSERFSKKRKLEHRTLHRPSYDQDVDDGTETGQISPNYDDEVVDTVVTTSTDALGLLFRAAEQQATEANARASVDHSQYSYHSTKTNTQDTAASPAIPLSRLSTAMDADIELWKRHSFVRQGYFSSTEAITYVELFLQNLACLSPISSYLTAFDEIHRRLVLEEPLLCCAILMISSRYHVLPAPGASARGELIHMRLWKHCETLIARLTFGQEMYTTTKLRSIGTVQALLLLTEWHARSLHFPPEHDGWDASLIASNDKAQNHSEQADPSLLRWKLEVSEPAKRSDRMSWMLVGLATSLAHELGVFEDPAAEDFSQVFSHQTQIRAQRALFVYVNQLSLRINRSSPLPANLNLELGTTSRDSANLSMQERDSYISQFIEITKLRRTTTEVLFASKSATRQIMRSGRHVSLLEHFQPLFDMWLQKFRNIKYSTLPESSRQILLLDYCYVKMYSFSIAMQAVVERAKSKGGIVALDFEYVKRETQKEYAFIRQVIDAARTILETAVELAEAQLLRYCPVRVFISISSGAIFLLKAISLGSRQSEISKSLEILEKCTHVLRHNTYDDMHLASKYGQILDGHIDRLKKGFHAQAAASKTGPETLPLQTVAVTHTSEGSGMNASNLPSDTAFHPMDMNGVNVTADDWLAQPFDPAFAPFDFDLDQTISGLETNSLDFLWNVSN
jgi:hypothetical protein